MYNPTPNAKVFFDIPVFGPADYASYEVRAYGTTSISVPTPTITRTPTRTSTPTATSVSVVGNFGHEDPGRLLAGGGYLGLSVVEPVAQVLPAPLQ
ncbi:MAG: hypothetical protein Q8R28_09315 [Dehalococcoidia bacterium]|nr:hypothetical protein [Dehalococcoidia bacterium]